ncbi:hypothetical protein FRC10_005380, partial [Ceratobasidium sp. 414]
MTFKFKPFMGDSTPHAQLQEWADYYHVKLGWGETKGQTQGITEWTSYPISMPSVIQKGLQADQISVQGEHYSAFEGIGKSQKCSRAAAAERIIACSRTL